ncbi:MAG: polysaccharide deacetylase [Chlorobi bacterium]|nr:polysaccharide deacetylase [Chlorobiota bacterium]
MADRRYTINAFTVKLEVPPSISTGPLDTTPSDRELERDVMDLLGFFEKFDVHATFFTSDAITSRIPRLIRTISDAGHEAAILSPRFLSPLDQLLRFREEIATAKSRLEEALGHEVIGCRLTPITSGWRSPAMIETLVQEGFIYSSSTFPKQSIRPLLLSGTGKAHRLQTPSGTLWELPLTSWRPFGIGMPSIRAAGGPSLSVNPAWIVARGVEGMNRHGEPAILYIHSWGLSTADPDYGSLPLRERLLRYGPREEIIGKLTKIFRSYRFGSIREAFASRLITESSRPSNPRRTSIVRLNPDAL